MNLPEFLQTIVNEPSGERLGWVLLHSLWQFAVVSLIVAGAIRGLRDRSAALRYGALVAALTLTVGTSVVTWSQVTVAHRDLNVERRITAVDAVQVNDSASADFVGLEGSIQPKSLAPEMLPKATRLSDESRAEVGGLAQEPHGSTLGERVSLALRPYLSSIVSVWLIGVIVCSIRPLFGWLTLWRLKHRGVSRPPAAVGAALTRMSERLRIRRAVRVLQSTVAQVPLVVGYLRPVVLLPVSFLTNLPTAHLEAILAHELAHIRRHDFVVNLLQAVVETLFFYHPAVWWLSRRICIEREHCCDDLVVAVLENHAEYGRALVAVEELRGRTSILALGASDGSLLARIRRIVGAKSSQASASSGNRVLSGGLCLCCLILLATVMGGFGLNSNAEENAEGDIKVAAQKNGQYVAEVTEHVTVELIGVGMHPSKDTDWWTPDGRVLPAEDVVDRLSPTTGPPGKFTVMKGSPKQQQCREFLIHINGLLPTFDVHTDYGPVSAATGSESANGLWVGYHGAGPFASDTTSIRVGIATQPYGPAMTIDVNGAKQQTSEAMDESLRPLYGRVEPLRVKAVDRKTILYLKNTATYNELNNLCRWELHAIDLAGKKHRRTSESVPAHGPRELTFELPIAQIQRFEYRMKSYQHWVTFDNVSLESGQNTDVKITVDPPLERAAEVKQAEPINRAYFTTEQELKLSRTAAHNKKWFFVDLDRVRLLQPPFPVEIDQEVLPYRVLTPEASKLNAWLKDNGVDLIVASQPKPLGDTTGRMRQIVQTRSVRTQLKSVASRLRPQNDGLWTWNAGPSTVESRYARKNDSLFVSGVIPDSSSGEIDPETPDLNCFRTAENVIGVYVLEQPDFTRDELRLRISHVADSHVKMQDVMFEKGDVLSGKDGPADPVQFRRDKRGTIRARIRNENGSASTVKGSTYRHTKFDGGNSLMKAEGRFIDQLTIRQAAGRVLLAHFTDGFAPAFSDPVHVRSSEERQVTLVLKRGASASLKLQDEDGQPIVGAAVRIYPEMEGVSLGAPTVGTTSQDGEMLLKHVADMLYRLSIRVPGYEPIVRQPIHLAGPEDNVVTMRRSKITSGIVRNVAGAPAVGATLRAPVEVAEGWVGFLNGDNPGDGGELVATTDEQGRFVLDQLSGDLRRLFIVETTDGARAIVRNLECVQQNVEITVPERRDVIIRINGDFSRLPEGRRSRVVNVGQDIDFDTAIGNARCLVGGDATIEATGNGGIAVFRGLAIELDPSDASQQRLKVQIGSGNDVMQKADVNLIGDTRVELTLPATKSTE